MKFKGLDGRTYSKDISQYRKATEKSKGQTTLGNVLNEIFPSATILQEFPCLGTRLRLDFFLPTYGMAFEFDGRQHDFYVQHFHGDRSGFARGQLNDVRKNQWCEINDIILIRVKKEDLGNLRSIINEELEDRNDSLGE